MHQVCIALTVVLVVLSIVFFVLASKQKKKGNSKMARNENIVGGVLLALAVLCVVYGLYMKDKLLPAAAAEAPKYYYF